MTLQKIISSNCYLNVMFFLPDSIPFRNAYFGSGSENQSIFLDNVVCQGTESSLLECDTNPIGEHNCDHSEDAGVRCEGILVSYLVIQPVSYVACQKPDDTIPSHTAMIRMNCFELVRYMLRYAVAFYLLHTACTNNNVTCPGLPTNVQIVPLGLDRL